MTSKKILNTLDIAKKVLNDPSTDKDWIIRLIALNITTLREWRNPYPIDYNRIIQFVVENKSAITSAIAVYGGNYNSFKWDVDMINKYNIIDKFEELGFKIDVDQLKEKLFIKKLQV